jgi:DNA-binding response OmpR family regulator
MRKVLLIEDNTEIRENTAEILELAGYLVFTAPNGKVGVDLASKEIPDVIICDIMMPELDGYGVIHILSRKQETAAIPFIFLTAKTEKTDIRKGMTLGADDYLTKPFDDTDLLSAVEARLKKRDMHEKHYAASAEGLDHFLDDARQVLNIRDLARDKRTKLYNKKAVVYSEGDAPQYVYFVKTGNVKGFKAHPDGKELITALYGPNDFIGFEAILENAPYADSAVSLQDAELVMIPRHDFLTLIQAHGDVSTSFIRLLCKKVADREKQLITLAYNSVRQRTAEALIKAGALKDARSTIAISREDLAKLVGTAAESVIRVLADFKEEGILETEGGRIRILNLDKLEKVVRWSVAR